MARPDWHYGDVLAHPMLRELRVMFIAFEVGPDGSLTGMVLGDDRGFAVPWFAGDVRHALEWGSDIAPAILVEKGER